MSSDRIIEMQHQIRENSSDLDNYLRDLKNWESQMKKKDKEIREAKSANSGLNSEDEPPKGSNTKAKKSASTASEKKKRALDMKDAGNDHFKKGNFDKAIEFYTSGMNEDAENAVFPANRAMAYMKIGKMALAEKDCNEAIALDPSYVKAYLRRGSVRLELKNFWGAEKDFLKVLELEPKNKQASSELQKVREMQNARELVKPSSNQKSESSTSQFIDRKAELHGCGDRIMDSSIIYPVKKSDAERSKKPLVTIKVKNVSSAIDIAKEEEVILSNMSQNKDDPTADTDCKILLEKHSLGKKIEGSSHVDSSSKFGIEVMKETESLNLSESEKEVKSKNIAMKHSPCQVKTVALSDVSLPAVPKRSYQFQADWKIMKDHPHLQYQYLKQFPPNLYPSLFECSMESELFTDILRTMAEQFIVNGDDVSTHLLFLCKIGRFHTLMMFMTEEDNLYLKKLMDHVNSSNDCSVEEKRAICKTYNC